MSLHGEFVPSTFEIVLASSNKAVGRAMELMLRAIGFKDIESVAPTEACKTVQTMEKKPDFVLFTQDYLLSPEEEKQAAGFPCSETKWRKDALLVMMLREKDFESVMMSQEMGFDYIVFADTSIDQMRKILEDVFLRHRESGLD